MYGEEQCYSHSWAKKKNVEKDMNVLCFDFSFLINN